MSIDYSFGDIGGNDTYSYTLHYTPTLFISLDRGVTLHCHIILKLRRKRSFVIYSQTFSSLCVLRKLFLFLSHTYTHSPTETFVSEVGQRAEEMNGDLNRRIER